MSQFVTDRSYDYFDLGDESDQEGAESSEDEIDIILHGTPEQRRRLCQSHAREQRHKQTRGLAGQTSRQQLRMRDTQQSSSEDEFEKEMNDELNKTVTMLEMSRGSNRGSGLSIEASSHEATTGNSGSTSQSSSNKNNNSKRDEGESETAPFYNDIYFDSDDDDNFEGAGENRKQRHHARPSNDDLLYDPDMDDEDQRWVDRQRRQHGAGASHSNSRQAAGRGGKKRTAAAMTGATRSDAVLDCPACMTTLCIDCQRHDIYPTQFRAMFVMNCKTNFSELLSVPEQAAKKKNSKKSKKSKAQASEQQPSDSASGVGGGGEGTSGSSADQFHPVMCDECDTVVGVVDKEEVYHFFNVIVGQA